jgi:hypothetical protein
MANALERYLAEGGVRCPRCGSKEVDCSDAEFDAGGAWGGVTCLACGLEWRDRYELVGVRLIDENLLGPDGEFVVTEDSVTRNDDGSWTVFQGCGGDYDSCEDHWVDIELGNEGGKEFVCFSAYDNNSRRGGAAVPAIIVEQWRLALEVDRHTIFEFRDEFSILCIDPTMGDLSLSTFSRGDFTMPFSSDGIAALFAVLHTKEAGKP